MWHFATAALIWALLSLPNFIAGQGPYQLPPQPQQHGGNMPPPLQSPGMIQISPGQGMPMPQQPQVQMMKQPPPQAIQGQPRPAAPPQGLPVPQPQQQYQQPPPQQPQVQQQPPPRIEMRPQLQMQPAMQDDLSQSLHRMVVESVNDHPHRQVQPQPRAMLPILPPQNAPPEIRMEPPMQMQPQPQMQLQPQPPPFPPLKPEPEPPKPGIIGKISQNVKKIGEKMANVFHKKEDPQQQQSQYQQGQQEPFPIFQNGPNQNIRTDENRPRNIRPIGVREEDLEEPIHRMVVQSANENSPLTGPNLLQPQPRPMLPILPPPPIQDAPKEIRMEIPMQQLQPLPPLSRQPEPEEYEPPHKPGIIAKAKQSVKKVVEKTVNVFHHKETPQQPNIRPEDNRPQNVRPIGVSEEDLAETIHRMVVESVNGNPDLEGPNLLQPQPMLPILPPPPLQEAPGLPIRVETPIQQFQPRQPQPEPIIQHNKAGLLNTVEQNVKKVVEKTVNAFHKKESQQQSQEIQQEPLPPQQHARKHHPPPISDEALSKEMHSIIVDSVEGKSHESPLLLEHGRQQGPVPFNPDTDSEDPLPIFVRQPQPPKEKPSQDISEPDKLLNEGAYKQQKQPVPLVSAPVPDSQNDLNNDKIIYSPVDQVAVNARNALSDQPQPDFVENSIDQDQDILGPSPMARQLPPYRFQPEYENYIKDHSKSKMPHKTKTDNDEENESSAPSGNWFTNMFNSGASFSAKPSFVCKQFTLVIILIKIIDI